MKTKILFVCHGNICRSIAGEFIFKDLIKNNNLENEFEVASRALSSEEIGNDIYPPMKACLKRHNVPFSRHSATKFSLEDYKCYDRIYIMDDRNKRLISSFTLDPDNKIEFLNGCIEDPWYTDNYDKVFEQIKEGCIKILKEYKND